MRRVLKWIGVVLGVLLLIVLAAGVVLYIVGRNNLNKTYNDVTAEAITLPADEAALERGKHLAEAVSLCAECHGDDYGGHKFLDAPVLGSGEAPNLTAGVGGFGAEDHTVEDWVRVIRHGVLPDGKPLIVMPSNAYYYMSDADLGALIAYLQSVPPVDNDTKSLSPTPLGTIMVGALSDLPVEKIDDHTARPAAPEEGVTVEYGEYLVNIGSCRDCHGDKLSSDVPMGAPKGPDLTQSGDLGGWSEQDFIDTMRQGITPDGDHLDSDEMPWNYYTRMTDDELKAIWMYLQTY